MVFSNSRLATSSGGKVSLQLSKSTIAEEKMAMIFRQLASRGFILLAVSAYSHPSFSFPADNADSAVAAATTKYQYTNVFQYIFIGKNYRKEWSMPVKMPVFDISKQQGGLKIIELGGGQQTKSLRMEDKQGVSWVLRTVDKNVEKAVPAGLRNTPVKGIIQEAVSASHPYAALTVGSLASAMGIAAAKPKLFYVPDDPALGEHRQLFAGQVCLLERREPTRNRSEALDLGDALKAMQENNDQPVLQKEALKARLLDMLVGDWDRHAKQWRADTLDSAKRKYYYLIPVDRDQAFFHADGLLFRVARLKMPYFRGFKKNFGSIRKLSKKAWNMDRMFLNELSEKDWEQTITEVQHTLTDSVIDAAVKKLPPEIYALNGDRIAGYLKNRRSQLLKKGMNYYRFLSKDLYLIGTNEPEYINMQASDGKLNVSVYNCKERKKGCKIYERTLDKKYTKRIYLVELNEQDKVEGTAGDSRIKVKRINGKKAGEYNLRRQVLAWLEEKG